MLGVVKVIVIWEFLSQSDWQLEIKGIGVNRHVLVPQKEMAQAGTITLMLCLLKLWFFFKMVKLGVSKKTALGEDCCLVSDFSWCLIRFLFPFLLSSKERLISRETKATLETEWPREKEHGESEALLMSRVEWLQLLHWMLSQLLSRMIGVHEGKEILD